MSCRRYYSRKGRKEQEMYLISFRKLNVLIADGSSETRCLIADCSCEMSCLIADCSSKRSCFDSICAPLLKHRSILIRSDGGGARHTAGGRATGASPIYNLSPAFPSLTLGGGGLVGIFRAVMSELGPPSIPVAGGDRRDASGYRLHGRRRRTDEGDRFGFILSGATWPRRR
jgi:hypothetical protein